MGKIVPLSFSKRAVIQFKIVKDVRHPSSGQVIQQREMNVTKVFKPTTTLFEVMQFVIDKSNGVGEGCLLIFETDNPGSDEVDIRTKEDVKDEEGDDPEMEQ